MFNVRRCPNAGEGGGGGGAGGCTAKIDRLFYGSPLPGNYREMFKLFFFLSLVLTTARFPATHKHKLEALKSDDMYTHTDICAAD